MRLAIREGMARGETLAEKLEWIAKMGMEGIELHGPALSLSPPELQKIFAGSPVQATYLAGRHTLLHPDPAERAAGKETIRSRLRLAGALGAVGVLIVPQFNHTPGLPDLSPYKTAVELEQALLRLQLQELAPVAAEAGVSLILEPLNRYEAHLLNRLDQAVEVAEEISPEVRVLADFFHMNIEETSIPASIDAAARHIAYVHIADSNRRQPGRGHLDFQAGFAALKGIGYDGFLGFECQIHGPVEEALADSIAYVKARWAEA